MAYIKPVLSILPPAQLKLFEELSSICDEFTLYGGTAIALQLGHREFVDFDFFSFCDFDLDQIIDKYHFLHGGKVTQNSPNTLTLIVDRDGPVQISFFGVPKLKRLCTPHILERNNIRIAQLIDLAGMKAAVIQKRAEAKDYIDIAAIIEQTDITLGHALSAAMAIYPVLNPELSLKALCYYDDGNLSSIQQGTKDILMKAAQNVDLDSLPDYNILCR